MRIFTSSLAAALAGLLVVVSPLVAQEAPAAGPTSERGTAFMDAALADHVPAADRHRAQLADLLANPEVRDLAAARGLDMERVDAAAEVLSDGEVAGLVPLVERVSKAMAAEQMGTIRISVVAIIVILLILILVT